MKKIILFLSILIAAGLTAINAQDTWTQKADFGGTARHTAIGFVIGDKAYVGTGNDGIDQKDFWEYDPSTDVWTQIADFGGAPREAARAFSIGSKGYVGTGQNGSTFYGDFWEYNPAINEWTQKADVGGLPRRGGVGFSIGEKGYIGIGHNVNGYTLDFWEYDPVEDTWTEKADFPGAGRENLVGFSIGSLGYVGTGNGVGFKNDFWEYNPAANAWTQKANVPGTVRTTAIGFAIGNKGYVGTGWDYVYLKDFYEYDPALNNWTRKADFGGTGRERAVGFSIGNKGYVGTGWDGNSMSDIWEYTPGTEPSCAVPSGLTTVNITSTSAKLKWNAVDGVPGYVVRYRVTGTQTWTYKTATTSAKNISDLLPETSYTWSVKTFCSVDPPGVSSDWAPKQTFTTGTLRLAPEQLTTLEVYPNPTSGQFTIAITLDEQVASYAMIQVINSLGQIVYNGKTSVANGLLLKEIQVNDLPAGMYLVKVIVNDQVYSASINFQK